MRRITVTLLTVVLAVMLAGPAGATTSAWGTVYCGWHANPYVQSYSIGLTEHFAPGGWGYNIYFNDTWTTQRTYSGLGTGGGSWGAEVIGEGSLDPARTYGGCG